MDKIKAFFNNKIVKIVSWVILALDIVCLWVGGVSSKDISAFNTLIFAGVASLSAIVAFITTIVKK